MYSHALPRNARDGFEEVLKNINPFMSEKMASDLWNHGKEQTVAQIIGDFPDVSLAKVVIDPMREVRIGGGIEPSATVTITMRSGIKASQQLVDAAADVVQGRNRRCRETRSRWSLTALPGVFARIAPMAECLPTTNKRRFSTKK